MEYVKTVSIQMKKKQNPISKALTKQAGTPVVKLSSIRDKAQGTAEIYIQVSNETRGSIRDIKTYIDGQYIKGESHLDYSGFDGYKLGKVKNADKGYEFIDWILANGVPSPLNVRIDTRDLEAQYEIALDSYIRDTLEGL